MSSKLSGFRLRLGVRLLRVRGFGFGFRALVEDLSRVSSLGLGFEASGMTKKLSKVETEIMTECLRKP